jgi:hypothetical protein
MNAIVALAVTANQLAVGRSKTKRETHLSVPATPKR